MLHNGHYTLTKALGVKALSKRMGLQWKNSQDVAIGKPTMTWNKCSQQAAITWQLYTGIIMQFTVLHYDVGFAWRDTISSAVKWPKKTNFMENMIWAVKMNFVLRW